MQPKNHKDFFEKKAAKLPRQTNNICYCCYTIPHTYGLAWASHSTEDRRGGGCECDVSVTIITRAPQKHLLWGEARKRAGFASWMTRPTDTLLLKMAQAMEGGGIVTSDVTHQPTVQNGGRSLSRDDAKWVGRSVYCDREAMCDRGEWGSDFCFTVSRRTVFRFSTFIAVCLRTRGEENIRWPQVWNEDKGRHGDSDADSWALLGWLRCYRGRQPFANSFSAPKTHVFCIHVKVNEPVLQCILYANIFCVPLKIARRAKCGTPGAGCRAPVCVHLGVQLPGALQKVQSKLVKGGVWGDKGDRHEGETEPSPEVFNIFVQGSLTF